MTKKRKSEFRDSSGRGRYRLYVGNVLVARIVVKTDAEAKRHAKRILKQSATLINPEDNKNIDVL